GHEDVEMLYFFLGRGEVVSGMPKRIAIQKSVYQTPGSTASCIAIALHNKGYMGRYGRLSSLKDEQNYTVADTTVFSFYEPTAEYVNLFLRNQNVVILDNFSKNVRILGDFSK
ncbi:MAG: hypothetical protein ABIF01_02485, partial [Candidatus Micrarchaeota archaeon]